MMLLICLCIRVGRVETIRLWNNVVILGRTKTYREGIMNCKTLVVYKKCKYNIHHKYFSAMSILLDTRYAPPHRWQ